MTLPAIADRVRETSTSIGTSIFALLGAPTGYREFSTAFAAEERFYYTIANRAMSEWESGIGYYGVATPNGLNRERVIQGTNGSSFVDFSDGTKDVVCGLPVALAAPIQYPGHNYLINGDGRFFQRQAPATPTSRADDTYAGDRWYVLTQTAAVNVERSTGDTARYAHKITQPQASSQKFGYAQIVEHSEAYRLRGKEVCARVNSKLSTANSTNIAILEWTGTADTVTSDVVNNWSSLTFTPGNFFNSTNLTLVGYGLGGGQSGNWDTLECRGTVSSSANNLIVIVWTFSQVAQNATIEITEAQLVEGSEPRLWLPPDPAVELLKCQRYYEKNLSLDTGPANGVTAPTYSALAYSTTVLELFIPFKVSKRRDPTLTFFRGPSGGTAGMWTYFRGGSWHDASGPAGVITSENFTYDWTGSSLTAQSSYLLEGIFTADAEL